MIYTLRLQKAIKFAVKTHQVYQQQMRKGKAVPYITHPLTVGLILSQAGADDDVIIAGILHDTIEDSIPKKKVSREMLAERFGEVVADLVNSVTEKDKSLSWEARKERALKEAENFDHNSVLVKSADVIANLSELLMDYQKEGLATFERFNAPVEKTIKHSLVMIRVLVERWPDNPLKFNLTNIAEQLQQIPFMAKVHDYPATKIKYEDYSDTMPLECPICGWQGSPKAAFEESHDDLLDVSCPICEKMLLIAWW